MTTTLIILVITVALFIWGRVRADIVALTAQQNLPQQKAEQ